MSGPLPGTMRRGRVTWGFQAGKINCRQGRAGELSQRIPGPGWEKARVHSHPLPPRQDCQPHNRAFLGSHSEPQHGNKNLTLCRCCEQKQGILT